MALHLATGLVKSHATKHRNFASPLVFSKAFIFRYACFLFLGAFSKQLRNATISVVMSVLLHGIERLWSDVFLWNSILGILAKICQHFPTLVKVGRKYQMLHVKSNLRTLMIPHRYVSSYRGNLCFLWVDAEAKEIVTYNWQSVFCDVWTETEETDELRVSGII